MSETPCASLFSVLGVLDDDISAVQQWVVSVPLPFLHCNGQCIAYCTAECTAHCALLKVATASMSHHHPPCPPPTPTTKLTPDEDANENPYNAVTIVSMY